MLLPVSSSGRIKNNLLARNCRMDWIPRSFDCPWTMNDSIFHIYLWLACLLSIYPIHSPQLRVGLCRRGTSRRREWWRRASSRYLLRSVNARKWKRNESETIIKKEKTAPRGIGELSIHRIPHTKRITCSFISFPLFVQSTDNRNDSCWDSHCLTRRLLLLLRNIELRFQFGGIVSMSVCRFQSFLNVRTSWKLLILLIRVARKKSHYAGKREVFFIDFSTIRKFLGS